MSDLVVRIWPTGEAAELTPEEEGKLREAIAQVRSGRATEGTLRDLRRLREERNSP